MAFVGTVPTLVNQSQHINASVAPQLSPKPLDHSQPEHMLMGFAMAVLVLVIVFGKLLNIFISD